MVLLDGKTVAAQIREEVRLEAADLPRKPGLATILVGDDPASRVYVNGKRRDCAACGFYSEEYTLPIQTPQADLLDLIQELNNRADIDGILLQLPLPPHMDAAALVYAIAPDKDVDGFHPVNVGQLCLGRSGFAPCTPAGILALLDVYHIDPAGKRAVVVGRSNLVGKPLSLLLLARDATVTVCHSKTPDLAALCREADILVTAAGQRGLITGDMVKSGAAVIDVSINRDETGRLYGDVNFDAVAQKAAFLTPVPGGVGPMTRAMLMRNTLLAAKKSR